MSDIAASDLALLNDWQRGFPLEPRPYARIGERMGRSEGEVIARLRRLMLHGAFSRIGGVWGTGAGGSALLAALSVPQERLEVVAARVSAVPGVNHNYEREHEWNLWFVMTGRDAASVHLALDAIEADTGLVALRLPMQRVYRIDLGFDLCGSGALRQAQGERQLVSKPHRTIEPVDRDDEALAAFVEQGLPLVPCPFDAWSALVERPRDAVLRTLDRWLARGTLRRFGIVVRHHETGYAHNAMAVFDVPDVAVDVCGEALARQPGVTLAYRRARAGGWPYNLYAMVHGRDRESTRATLHAAAAASALAGVPQALLFSRHRFKQCGARYFGAPVPGPQHDPFGLTAWTGLGTGSSKHAAMPNGSTAPTPTKAHTHRTSYTP